MSSMGSVHSFETFGSVDGPGVRFVIFLNGCKMRCQYCHNVDTWQMKERNYTSDEVLAKALRYKSYWKSDGGITISGGEPLLQIDFITEIFKKAKEKGIHTTLDTCGQPFTREESFFFKLEELMKYTDLVLLDLKHIDAEKHRALTSQKNENILEFASYLDSIKKPIWIRHVLVPSINDDEDSLQRLSTFIKTLSNVERLEVLPYHTLGSYKWEELNIPYALKGIQPPTKEMIEKANKLLHTDNYKTYEKR
ncbi:pyruvate formate-lyase-activating protein [Amedibacillus sp. YH-ame10]